MSDFRNAVDRVLADLTPQPWDYTTPDGTTLTVIPEGLPSDIGYAEVTIQVTAGKDLAAEIGIMTPAMPGLLAALGAATAWEGSTVTGDVLTVTPTDDAMVVVVVERVYSPGCPDCAAAIRMPAAQRLPFASALRRALDVARGWES